MGSLLKSAGAASSFQASNPYGQAFLDDANQNYSAVRDKQNTLGGQLLARSQGIDPASQLNFEANSQKNIAGIQGLIAAQRGLNPALQARMGVNAAVQANSEQANQAAILNANRQIAAEGQLQQLYASQQQGNLAQQHLYGQGQQGANQLNQQTQGQNAGIVGNTIGGLTNAAGGIGAALLTGGAAPAAGAIAGGMGGGGGVAAGTMPTANDYAAWTGADKLSKGGRVGYSDGGMTDPASYGNALVPSSFMSLFAKYLADENKKQSKQPATGPDGAQNKAMGGDVDLKTGGSVKGKAKVPGDSETNDTVPAMLSPGEVVIPRTKAHDPEKAKEFVDHLLKSKDDGGYGKILEHKRKVAELEKRVKSLEGRKKSA